MCCCYTDTIYTGTSSAKTGNDEMRYPTMWKMPVGPMESPYSTGKWPADNWEAVE